MELSQIDCDVLLAKSEPRPLFVVIRPHGPISADNAERIRQTWQQFVNANPDANIPPCILITNNLDIEAVCASNGPKAEE
jgi:hypothetical protein